MTAPWPQHPDGRNKKMGEMPPEERRAQMKASAERFASRRLFPPRARIDESEVPY